METTNVGLNEETVTPNMIVTYPGRNGFEVSIGGKSITVKNYLKEIGNLNAVVLNNTEKELRAYLAKYDPEKLKEYEAKKAKEVSDEGR